MSPDPVALVVDDESSIRDLVRRVLEADRWKVVEADGAPEALKITAVTPVGLLVTDVHMPGMDGLELAEAMRTRHPEIKILYVTGHPQRVRERWATLPYGEALLEKPFTAAALRESAALLVFGTVVREAHDPRR